MASYQNSIPGQLSGEGTDLITIDEYVGTKRSSSGRIVRAVMTLGAVLLVFAAVMGSYPIKSNALRGGELNEVALLQQSASSTMMSSDVVNPADMPQPDYNGEGKYDWEKCMSSKDPDCWKQEGERVGSFWQNFGLRMKTFWLNFRQSIHDFFTGKKEEVVQEKTTETKKKHSKKKAATESAANATVAP
jgi:hypothetical protein